MPLDTTNILGDMPSSAGRVFANPMCMALMITIVIMIIITYSHDGNHKFRTSFRVFWVVLLFSFLNNHIIMAEMNEKMLSNDQKFILDDINGGGSADSVVPIEEPKLPSFVVARPEGSVE